MPHTPIAAAASKLGRIVAYLMAFASISLDGVPAALEARPESSTIVRCLALDLGHLSLLSRGILTGDILRLLILRGLGARADGATHDGSCERAEAGRPRR